MSERLRLCKKVVGEKFVDSSKGRSFGISTLLFQHSDISISKGAGLGGRGPVSLDTRGVLFPPGATLRRRSAIALLQCYGFRFSRPNRLNRADDHSRDQRQHDRGGPQDDRFVPLCEFPELIRCGGRAGNNRFIAQMTPDVGRELSGGRITPVFILLQRLCRDDLDVAAISPIGRTERCGRSLPDGLDC
ncbi:MAG: hypothetical protein NTY38_32905, partial [Acidobacteria bacterium]|nr:hypothetical protein [Acidobacteriota bacterium]